MANIGTRQGPVKHRETTGLSYIAAPLHGLAVDIDTLNIDAANARKHGERNMDAIKASLHRWGQRSPVVVQREGMVVRAGNGRVEAARALGWTQIAAVVVEESSVEATAFAIADNRTSELAEWETETLASLLDTMDPDVLADTGFDDSDIKALLRELEPDEVVDVEAVEPPADPVTKPGDLWLLGRHRLVCGDCTDAAVVARALDGVKVNVAFTSPPYASQRKYDETTVFRPIPPDDYCEWFDGVQRNVADNLAGDGSWFVNIKEHCEDGQRSLYVKDLTIKHVREWGWLFVEEYCWTHEGTPKAANQRFKNAWEPVFQFARGRHKFRPDNVMHKSGNAIDWKKPSGNSWEESSPGKVPFERNTKMYSRSTVDWGGRHPSQNDGQGLRQRGSNASLKGTSAGGKAIHDAVEHATDGMAYPSNVISPGKNKEALGHGAAFPVGLPEFFIKAYSDGGDAIYDPFLGSGTTLIAAHQLDRTCYGCEISPAYCDVIVNRWEKLTGEKATREAGNGGV